MALKRMGFQDRLVSHGMRSMASTILNEHGWDPELIEVALAHVETNSGIAAAYESIVGLANSHSSTPNVRHGNANRSLIKFALQHP